MPRLAANLSVMFTEVPFEERFAAAAQAGFRAVEFLFPYEYDPAALRARLDENGLEQVLFNMPPGDWQAGERGLAGLPGRQEEFLAGVEQARDYALALGCPRLHCMAGCLDFAVPLGVHSEIHAENVARAAELVADDGLTLTIEPINTRDVPGYLVAHTADALSVIGRVGAPNLALQFDIYHAHMMGEDVTAALLANIERIAHIQVSDAPGRHEPGTGEIDYRRLLPLIDEIGYTGWVGCEYRPKGHTEGGLVWAEPWLHAPDRGVVA